MMSAPNLLRVPTVLQIPLKSTLFSLAFAAMWAASAPAGIISSTDNAGKLQGCSSIQVESHQPVDDSSEETLRSSQRTGDMTRVRAFGDGPDLPSGAGMVQWPIAASATSHRVTLSPDPKLRASIPIELLKIPIAMSASCSCS